MIKYFVRTTGERALDDSFERELKGDYTLLVDYNHNSGKAFFEQLDIINDYDSVVMEDDIILCKNFKKYIEDVINTYPHNIINFFTSPMNFFTTFGSKSFSYNQCVYFPKNIARKIKDAVVKYNIKIDRQEIIMRDSLKYLKLSHICYRPCLVQHIDKNSLMNHNPSFCRRSPFFIDYLNELGIDYKDAHTKDNYIKLIKLMELKFKD